MKTFKTFIAIIVFSCVFISYADAQALVVKDKESTLFGYVSYDSHSVITPSGKFNMWANFQFDMDDPWVMAAIDAGEPLAYFLFGFDEHFGFFAAVALIYPTGRVTVSRRVGQFNLSRH